MKAKLAQKEAERAARIEAGEDDEYDSDSVLDPREKARRDKERELNADLNNAAELLGAAALGGILDTISNYLSSYDVYRHVLLGTRLINFVPAAHERRLH